MNKEDFIQVCDLQRDFGYCYLKECSECEFKKAYEKGENNMTIGKLREIVPNHTTVWVEDYESGEFVAANEFRYVDKKYDEYEIVIMFPERYPGISAFGLTLHIKKGK